MTPNRYDVFVSPSADRKLAAHIEFLSRVSEPAAERLYMAYEDALRFLASTPEISPAYIPIKPIGTALKYRIFGKRYRVVYEITGSAVYVYDIQDFRQDTDKSLVD